MEEIVQIQMEASIVTAQYIQLESTVRCVSLVIQIVVFTCYLFLPRLKIGCDMLDLKRPAMVLFHQSVFQPLFNR